VQRIFNCDKIQDTSVTSEKVLNIVTHGLPLGIIARIKHFKCGPFVACGPPCIHALVSHAVNVARQIYRSIIYAW